jgi:hypothetical protein
MTLDDIMEEWKKDCNLDRTELGEESLKIPKLHHKYYQMFSRERLLLKKYESEMKRLKLDKYEFYTMGPSDESREKGWTIPARGMILKSDVTMYMEADPDIIETNLKICYQQEKTEVLESIIKSFVGRGFNIKAAIEFEKFKMGA